MMLMDTNTNQSYYDTKWYTLNNVTNKSLYYLPFIPQFNERGSYDQYSVSLNATHESYDFFNLQTKKWENKAEIEYNLHSLYGHAMMHTTYNALISIASNNKTSHLHDKRLFVLTRSTFTSTNRYASYAVRSKYRTWEGLRYAIPHLMNMNMFGFVHSGADACGSNEYNPAVT
jgi:alpha-glucosidase (family GH31 glycosyl hydrolase)